MKNKLVSLLAIILGIIIIAFPMLGVIGTSALFGISILFIAIVLLLMGVSIIDYKRFGAIVYFFLGIIMLIFSLILIFNPKYFAFLGAIMLYLAGIFLIIIGVVALINDRHSRYGFYTGIFAIILGVIYIIVGTYIADPLVLGTLIGIWLIITGVFKFIED